MNADQLREIRERQLLIAGFYERQRIKFRVAQKRGWQARAIRADRLARAATEAEAAIAGLSAEVDRLRTLCQRAESLLARDGFYARWRNFLAQLRGEVK